MRKVQGTQFPAGVLGAEPLTSPSPARPQAHKEARNVRAQRGRAEAAACF